MTADLQVYRCKLCGTMVEILHGGEGTLVCCGEDMSYVAENSTEAAKEKHVPIVTKTLNGFKVTVGSTLHPMEERHFIEWIELIADGDVCRHPLRPGEKPEAEFDILATTVSARAHCNLHGLWKA